MSENKLRGLYFSKALFEGLTLAGSYIRSGLSMEENLRFKIVNANVNVYVIIHFPQGFSGIIYNTGWGKSIGLAL